MVRERRETLDTRLPPKMASLWQALYLPALLQVIGCYTAGAGKVMSSHDMSAYCYTVDVITEMRE